VKEIEMPLSFNTAFKGISIFLFGAITILASPLGVFQKMATNGTWTHVKPVYEKGFAGH
jgi:hypothetical protein